MSKQKPPPARIFIVDTRFQRMARRAGGVPRERAIESAEAEIDQLKPGFDDWLNAELRQLNDIVQRARSGDAAADWAQAALKHCRPVRDVGTTMGLELLTCIASALCEILDAAVAGATVDVDTVACHADAILLARHEPYRRMGPEQVPELIEGLRRIAGNVKSAAVLSAQAKRA